MNIKRAKQEIKDTIQAYLLKTEDGEYAIPAVRQRPVLLIGPPGIGKTQIMEQIARECKIGLVAYTITHHTRQSAIGLPFIVKKNYGGQEYSATEYTMSEIIASVYNEMESTGLREGILFIDEINCVSETLAPAMLQFLQCKTFGTHQVPPGWIIVAAGNPPEYNKSVREFDLVTLDRVKKIEVFADFSVWKEYAHQVSVHPAVLSYLMIRKQYFYLMETTVDGRFFATPRGWEDLSKLLEVYEKLNKTMDWEVIVQYIQYPKVARDFANYLELYRKYQTDYQVDAVLDGKMDPILEKKIAHAGFDERLSVISLFTSRLFQNFKDYDWKEKSVAAAFQMLKTWKETGLKEDGLERLYQKMQYETEEKRRAKILTAEEIQIARETGRILDDCRAKVLQEDTAADSDGNNTGDTGVNPAANNAGNADAAGACKFAAAKEAFEQHRMQLTDLYKKASEQLEHVFDFMETMFGNSQEMVIFLTELNSNYSSVQFLKKYSCERYYHWNEQLLFDRRHREIRAEMDALGL